MRDLFQIYKLRKIRKTLGEVVILDNIDLDITKGDFVAIVGPSGSGKSSLLYILGLLDYPDSGEFYILGDRLDYRNRAKIDELRNKYIGFVFQFHYLIPELNVLENVMLPLVCAGKNLDEAEARAKDLLEELGLGDKVGRRVYELSGGEMQRVAIARALANQPEILLCDEPTGNLDFDNTQKVVKLLKSINLKYNTTIILVTHDLSVAKEARRTIRMEYGKIKSI